jgi:hypothetical protein
MTATKPNSSVSRDPRCNRELMADFDVRELDLLVSDIIRLGQRIGTWLDRNPADGDTVGVRRIALAVGSDGVDFVYESLKAARYVLRAAGSGALSEMTAATFPLSATA